MEELSRVALISTLDEVGLSSPHPRAVVTFDDGYADNLWNALPIAQSMGVPVTVFVTSGKLDDVVGFWWDRLAAILRQRPAQLREGRLDIGPAGVRVPLGARPAADLSAVRQELLPLQVSEIERVLEQLADEWGVPASTPEDARPLTTDELVALASADVASIGAHTTDHVRLSGHPPDEQLATMADSRMALEALVPGDVLHFAYPFGGVDEFDETSVAAAGRAGFRTACTTLPGSATSSTDPLRLPRRLVMDWNRARFRAQLVRWNWGRSK